MIANISSDLRVGSRSAASGPESYQLLKIRKSVTELLPAELFSSKDEDDDVCV